MSAPPLLEVERLSKSFALGASLWRPRGAARLRAVDEISFAVARGETFGIVGESGSGKSTTARLILRLIEANSGAVRFNGEDLLTLDAPTLRRRRRGIQMVFQDPFASLNPRLSVGRHLAEPIALHGLAGGNEIPDRVAVLLARVGLRPEHARRYPHEFSGGQRQRIAVARALAAEPELMVADEPVSSLDVSVRAQILNLLDELRRAAGMAMIFISHDLGVVRHLADRVAVMYRGRIVELGATASIFAFPRHPYTLRLLAAMPVARKGGRRRVEAAPMQAEAEAAPAGCAYAPRCPLVRDACRRELPPLREIGTGHASACLAAAEVPPFTADLAATPPAARERIRRLQSRFLAPRAGGAA